MVNPPTADPYGRMPFGHDAQRIEGPPLPEDVAETSGAHRPTMDASIQN
jgi:hypothetical protein